MTTNDNQNDDVFSSAQQGVLKKAFKKLNTQLGIEAYDIEKQAQILKGRLDQISTPQPKVSKFYQLASNIRGGFSGRWFTTALASFGIGLVVSRVFFIAEPLQIAGLNFNIHSERNVQSVSSNNSGNEVLEAAQSVSSKLAAQPLEINIQTPDLDNERNKLIGIALQAGLSIQISGKASNITVRVDGLAADVPKQKAFKTLFKIAQEQEGPIIFTLIKQ